MLLRRPHTQDNQLAVAVVLQFLGGGLLGRRRRPASTGQGRDPGSKVATASTPKWMEVGDGCRWNRNGDTRTRHHSASSTPLRHSGRPNSKTYGFSGPGDGQRRRQGPSGVSLS